MGYDDPIETYSDTSLYETGDDVAAFHDEATGAEHLDGGALAEAADGTESPGAADDIMSLAAQLSTAEQQQVLDEFLQSPEGAELLALLSPEGGDEDAAMSLLGGAARLEVPSGDALQ